MNTTALYIEPLFVGALAIIAFGLPLAPELKTLLRDPNLGLPAGIALTSVATGIAYLLGIAFDRYLDTCLSVLERHNRVRFACLEVNKVWRGEDWQTRPWRDPMPEDDLRTRVMVRGGKLADFIDYVRSRVRLMRALAFLMPGIAAGAVVALLRIECMPTAGSIAWSTPQPARWCATVAGGDVKWSSLLDAAAFAPHALYLVLWLATFLISRADPARRKDATHQAAKWTFRRHGRWLPPRTNNDAAMRRYAADRRLTEDSDLHRWVGWDLICQPPVWFAALLLASAVALAFRAAAPTPLLAVALLGVAVTALAGWAWWRSTATFMTYLILAAKQPPAPKG